MISPTRRELLGWLPAAMVALRCAKAEPVKPPALRFLTSAEAETLAAVADAVLPPDGSTLGAVGYVDALLSAFDAGSPKLLVGALTETVPLDRQTERAWRLRLYGSDGVEGGGPNDAIVGKQVGLRQQVRDALAAAASAPLDRLTPEQRELLADLVTQAAFAAPVYGGNPNGAGWALVGSAGAVMPRGFTQWDEAQGKNVERPDAPVSTPEPGTDPHPLDDFTRALLNEVANATGGEVAS